MNKILKLWKWLDTKKTKMGAFLLLSAPAIQKLFEIWYGIDPLPEWLPKLTETINLAGYWLTGFGLGHQGIKTVNKVIVKN